MKNFNLLLLLAILLTGTFFTSCEDDSDDNNDANTSDCTIVSENITDEVTWTTGNCYVLASRVTVEEGATLNIEPGVLIKGQAGSGANATALLIARGGTINALGTASNPIIFTSIADEITKEQVAAGNIESPNLDPDQAGLWGGVIVLGNAPISADAAAVQIEGIPPSDVNGLYGGSDPADNSGVIQYISIRHGGSNIGDGNEINGLTLGGVGTGTVIENVEIVGNKDDGLECFGGTVNVSNVLVWNQGDDAFDMDQAYSGTVNNFVGIAGKESDHAMELDGPEGSDTGSFTLSNGSLKGYVNDDLEGKEYIDFRAGVTCTVSDCYFFNFGLTADVELDNDGVANNYKAGEIELRNLYFNVGHLNGEGNVTIEDIFQDKSNAGDAFSVLPLSSSIQAGTTSSFGADISDFSWTWASKANALEGF